MEVILLEKIQNLGSLGEQVRVKPGYGRNFLIPAGKAVPATKENVQKFEERRAELEKQQAEMLDQAKARAEKLNQLSVSISRKAGAEGKLFGSVGTMDISEAVKAEGVELAKQEILLPEGPFRVLGEYTVDLHLPADVEASIKLTITQEEELP